MDHRVKQCIHCKQFLPLSSYSVERRLKDGLSSLCRQCNSVASARSRLKNKETKNARERARYHEPKERARRLAKNRKYSATYVRPALTKEELREKELKHRLRNPEKCKARAAFKWAVKSGKITRQPCEVCGAPKGEGHHDDYSKPFEVQWLCRKHHMELHRVNLEALAA